MSYPQVFFQHKKLLLCLFIGVILCVGTFIRLYSLGTQSLWIDEGYSINASLSIQEHGYPLLDSGQFYGQGLSIEYLRAFFMSALNFDPFSPWSARLLSVIFGIFTVIVSFFLTRALFPLSAVPWVTSILLTFSTWEIAWSRQARGYIALQFFIILSFYFLWKWLHSQSWKNFILSILSFICAFLSHSIAIIFIPAFIVIYILHIILHPEKRLSLKNNIIAGVITLTLVAIILGLTQASIVGYDYSKTYFIYLFKELFLFSILSVIAIVIGIFSKKDFWPVTFLSSIILIPLIIIMEYGQAIQIRYLFPIFPFMVILVSCLISTVVNWCTKKIIKHGNQQSNIIYLLSSPIVVNTISVILGLIIFGSYLTFIPTSTYSLEWDSPQPDFKTVYSLIKETKKVDDLIISPHTMMSKIYLGENGIWLPISLTGKASEVEQQLSEGRDYYTGAPLIANVEQMTNILETQKGFIVMDGMTRIRLKEQFDFITTFPTVREIYKSGTGLDEIRLFYFEPKK
jgi:hypothetical protein